MENNPLERKAVTKAAERADHDDEPLVLTLRENVGDPEGSPSEFADTVLDFPTIDTSDEERYRVSPPTPPTPNTPIMGNKPYIPDAIRTVQPVRMIETQPDVLNEILERSPLAQKGLVDDTKSTWTTPAPRRQPPQQTSWLKRLFGGK